MVRLMQYLSASFRMCQICVFCRFLGFPPTIFASMCGSKDPPPYFESGELKKTCFGRHLDG